MTYVIALPRVDLKDRARVEECPVDCIYEAGRSLYFDDLGSPGGAFKTGVVPPDHALIAPLPPQESAKLTP